MVNIYHPEWKGNANFSKGGNRSMLRHSLGLVSIPKAFRETGASG
jgi:hypothetical protein